MQPSWRELQNTKHRLLRRLASLILFTIVTTLIASLQRALALGALILSGCSTLPPTTRTHGPTEIVMQIQDTRLTEISGMARSVRQPEVLWVHNDSGDQPRLTAVGPDGTPLGTLEITNAQARDWEDMAIFEIEHQPWLLIADVGDNGSTRQDTVIYLLPEPDPADFAQHPTMRINAASQLRFRYEDGPRDCEGVAVDVLNREILLISKRTEPPVLYTLPLQLAADEDQPQLVARRAEPLSGIIPPTAVERAIPGRLGQYRSQVTAFDLAPDQRTAAVLTYGNLYVYHRATGETWPETFAGQPERIPVKGLPQAEAVSFDEGGATLLITSEGAQVPVQRHRFRRP